MRVAFFSPLPPSPSGIADYSESLAAELALRTDLTLFGQPDPGFDPAHFDVAVYQIGNNPCHTFVYETALRHPGVVVMHEANLHHLIADLTIKRDNWDAYLAECEYNGGPAALAFAREVRALKHGPDYDGIAMTRRLLENARGLIVHSDFVAAHMRTQGYRGPIATIPHGSWPAPTTRNAARHELGLGEAAPLIGAFGYIKPYKRIAESLRALKRLAALEPRVRMILVGEPHPSFPIAQLIRTLGLQEHVRVIGFAPLSKFTEYMSACDIVLNLRYPTVGETSGSLQRALGMGKAVIVSDIGSFSELPDDICLKVPAGPENIHQEEDLIFEYLNLLVSRPDLARTMGNRAKNWIERECSWSAAAVHYAAFLNQFRDGRTPTLDYRALVAKPVGDAEPEPPAPAIEPEAITAWVEPQARTYAANHITRFVRTLGMVPPGDASKSILEMGAYMQITPALHFQLGYGNVRGCYYGKLGRTDRKIAASEDGQLFQCDVDHFDAEHDPYPYPDQTFDTVLCCELLEHLFADPMHMMLEINRILKPGGHLLITTPNLGSLRAISAILQGYHPSFFPAYIRPRAAQEETEARHNREYVPMEVQHLLTNSGFEIVQLDTGEFLAEPHPEFGWIHHLLEQYKLHETLRGDGIYALGRKTGSVKDRFPAWLYS